MQTRELVEDRGMERVPARYVALSTIASIFRILGWITVIGGTGLAVAAGSAAVASDELGIFEGLLIMSFAGLASIISGLQVLAFAYLIDLLIDVEENTRASALNLAEIE